MIHAGVSRHFASSLGSRIPNAELRIVQQRHSIVVDEDQVLHAALGQLPFNATGRSKAKHAREPADCEALAVW